ncbi:MAG: penicillin-binding protein beta-lactamase class, partial [Armatimonadetes bacterium]|nr:penicillin-binding protein beta-lactamase class [Armatimonadota bacterium]
MEWWSNGVLGDGGTPTRYSLYSINPLPPHRHCCAACAPSHRVETTLLHRTVALLLLAVGLTLPLPSAFTTGAAAAPVVRRGMPPLPTLNAGTLTTILSTARTRYKLPGMSAAVLQDGVTVVAADGLRQVKKTTPVTADDQWHLGSCGKAMTATLCARLVERGTLSWTTAIGATFPELAGTTRAEYASVTLRELLAHRSGLPDKFPGKVQKQLLKFTGTPPEARQQFVPEILKLRPVALPHTSFSYSSFGYAVAGAMAERITGTAYETLMAQEVFEPLGMSTAGFGAPGTVGQLLQPVGHTAAGKAVLPGPKADLPAAGNPAGLLHMSMQDWTRFAAVHLDEAGTSGYLTPASLNAMHQPFSG